MKNKTLKVKDLTFGFLPGWWSKHFGITYGKRYYDDPEYRMTLCAEVHKLFNTQCRSLLHYEPNPNPQPWPVKLDYGNATTGIFAGCEYELPDDDVARNKHLPREKLAALKLPEKIQDVFPYNQIVEQTLYTNQKYNHNELPTILPRGVLNEAFLIEGEKIFTDMYEDPDEARRMLDFSYGLLEKTVRYNYSVGYRGLVRVLNCTIQLVNPDMYEEWLLAYDMKIYDLAQELGLTFGIHHCGDLKGRLLDLYRKIPNYAYLQVGFNSDLERVIRSFPEAQIHFVYDPVFCMNATQDEIRKRALDIVEQAGDKAKDLSVGVGAIDVGVPLENLQVVFDALTE